MGRPKTYDDDRVIAAAREVFWRQGYMNTSVQDLEDVTGLSRSSLYHAFETKRGLFDAVLDDYLAFVISRTFGPAEVEDATVQDASQVFRSLADWFRGPGARRGCLMINSISELAGRDRSFDRPAARFLNRVRAAYTNALGDGHTRGLWDSRQQTEKVVMLTASHIGAWHAVRVDPQGAATMCDAIADQVVTWDQ